MSRLINRITNNKRKGAYGRTFMFFVCFVLLVVVANAIDKKTKSASSPSQRNVEKVILKHADKVLYNEYSMPGVQIFSGNVVFNHNGIDLFCDSANFFQMDNSFKAFGNVRMLQGDTLSLTSETLFYNGNTQIAEARNRVILKHREMTLYTDSLNYDRVFQMGYFFEGGKLVDKQSTLTSDWGQYNSTNRLAEFYYNVKLTGKDYTVTTDTLHYDTNTKLSHMLGKSNVINGNNTIYTENGYFNSETKRVRLLERSIVVNENQKIIGDSIIYNKEKGEAEAFGNVYMNDMQNKNIMTGNYCYYNDSTGYSISYDSALVKNYSEKDTLYLHADTFKIYGYNLKTDSAYRIVHGYFHSRSYRKDVQSVADSLSFNSKEKKLSLYGNPILWSDERQILGEVIYAHFNDSTLDSVHIVNQCLMAEKLDTLHYNQVAGQEMKFYFLNGELKENQVVGNVLVNYYAFDSDSLMIGMNHLETSLLRLYMEDKKMSKIWAREHTGTFYPVIFITPEQAFLSNFAWFDYMRPQNENDVFKWRPKASGTELRQSVRKKVPFQELKNIK